mgnify:CR=1 FL=1
MRMGMIGHDESVRGTRIKIRVALEKLGWQTTNLNILYPGADYAWFTSHEQKRVVGVQLKTTGDLLSSWWSGRLQEQIWNLISAVHIPVLIVEGPRWLDHKTGGISTQYGPLMRGSHHIPYSTYVEIIATLTGGAPARFVLIDSPDTSFTIEWLGVIGPKKYEEEEYASWNRIELPPRVKNTSLSMLLSWDGVGETRAREILQKYGTPFAALDALRNGGWNISGIGKGTEDKVRRQGNTFYHEKGDNA